MMSAPKRKTRPNTGGANRGERQRGRAYEKNIITDGVFANTRFTHVATSLLGCVVQLQVKNGCVYEGILKTYSPKMDVVLEMAHKCDDFGNNNQNAVPSSVPSKDRLIEKILFNVGDILTICASSVDMDYAVKDTFTDSAIINKQNGQTDEKLRELQPWDGEEGEEITAVGLDGDSSNGWDANEMFKTNAEQFNVKSTYDDKLTMYTTPLDKSDSTEFKAREEQAQRLAQEIERTDGYKARVELENGDENEEDKFSAVRRPQDNHTQSGKYVHPNKRNQQYNNQQQQQPPPQQQAQQPQQQQQQQHHTQHQMRNVRGGHLANHHPHTNNMPNRGGPSQQQTSSSSSSQQLMQGRPQIRSPPRTQHPPPPLQEETKQNNNTDKEKRHPGPSDLSTTKPSPVPEPVVDNQQDSINTATVSKQEKVDNRRNSDPRGQRYSELKDFKSNFKLENEKVEHIEDKVQEEASPVPTEKVEESPVKEQQPEPVEKSEKEKTDKEEPVIKSTLNPLAKEFVMSTKSFQTQQTPAQPQQIPTPPRPQTQQSPIFSMPAAQVQHGAHGALYPVPQYHNVVMPHSAVVSMTSQSQQQQLRPTKRAIVSIQGGPRPDLNAAAAQSVTGQPLLAHSVHTSHPSGYILPVQMPHMLPQPTGYQMGGQVMPMPNTGTAVPPAPRMTPTSGVQMVPTTHNTGVDHNTQSHSATPMYMPSHTGPMPAHVHAQFPHATPAHTIVPPQGQQQQQQQHQHQHQHQQAAQINQQQQSTNHPAPSPVQQQQQGPSVQSHTQGHPPTSGTPQPHPPYQQMTIQPHPPLQPSPHHPTSPQNMHQMPTQYFAASHHSGASHVQGNQQYPQGLPPNSAGGHNLQGQSPHMNHGQPQIVMMPQHNQQNPQQPQQQYQQGHSGIPHMAGPGQGPINYQTGVPNNPSNIHQHLPFVPQVHSQGAQQPYQQSH